MKAIHITDDSRLTIKRGSTVIVLNPKHANIAVWILELMACQFEKEFKKELNTDELWEVALELRKSYDVKF